MSNKKKKVKMSGTRLVCLILAILMGLASLSTIIAVLVL